MATLLDSTVMPSFGTAEHATFTAPIDTPSAKLAESRSSMMLGSAFGVQLIDAFSSYKSAKYARDAAVSAARHQKDIADIANRHAQRMAEIEFSLNSVLAARAEDDSAADYLENELKIQIGGMRAASQLANEAAGSGNVSGAASLMREVQANAIQASAANERDLMSRRRQFAAGSFERSMSLVGSRAPKTRLVEQEDVSPFGFIMNAGLNMVRIAQGVTKETA